MADKIIVKGLKIFAYHGVNREEKETGQLFILDIEALLDLKQACESDKLNHTLNYSTLIKHARNVFSAEKNDLIEYAAERTAQEILKEFSHVETLRLRVKKPDAPIKADFDYVAVEIERSRRLS